MNSTRNLILVSLGLYFGLSLILVSITSHFILTIKFFENSNEYLSGIPGQETGIYNSLQKYLYLSNILYGIFKLTLIALIINTGLYLSDVNVAFGKTFLITVLCEFIFLVPAIIKIFWFKHYYPNGTLTDWHRVYILSALSLVDKVPADWYYPLQTLNVFEVAYWFLLAFGIKKISKLNFDQSLRIVVLSYVPALFVWIAFISFCTVILSPGNA
ncbi:hypothetical protein DIU31_028325 [Mucilaginibacter rubeus]|uniref:Yip1 domain-containing protein n=1 Tax=Mucilaginibacter rubeus TaxID=2027860 RepID=A0AAE6JM17_9SPHI|nr:MULTISPECIES: hypothetical protein [Mucilaginibacter]QEM07215.1 hypothetical protein DIU31_028325 [Mucilaginibacter rubeus]QEM19671.1 hypothetical protein DIU38_027900 [Mucilaginibacter gossypii]QTE43632.1 hypothetical protein J3L19_32725 [Mucilaginibacter rubeus]QTE50232.1 hypothetical protein J3L21_32680 [Mucilaginibacter rubeus]QTE55320.1 hypothetical protein J3L23_24300 [Mucilaginibacter rubeus]